MREEALAAIQEAVTIRRDWRSRWPAMPTTGSWNSRWKLPPGLRRAETSAMHPGGTQVVITVRYHVLWPSRWFGCCSRRHRAHPAFPCGPCPQ
jgi:hypothetical protein